MRSVIEDVERRYGTAEAPADARTFVRETLAVMAERGLRNGILDRALTAVRRFLRRIMPNLILSERELRQLLVHSKDYLERGQAYAAKVQARAAMAFSRDQQAPEAFKPWPGEADSFRKQLRRTMVSLRTNEPPIHVADMPPVMRSLGVRDAPITVSRDVVRKATNGVKHVVPMQAIEQLPEELHDPLAVFRSKTEKDAFVVLTEQQDRDGKPVVIALDVRAKPSGYDVTRIASIYGKDGNPPTANWVRDGLLVYKSGRAESSPVLKGLQLPDSVSGENGPTPVLDERAVASSYGTMPVQQRDLRSIRDRFGRIEGWWRKQFGYGFDGLTAGEARTLLAANDGKLSPDRLRDRILAGGFPGIRQVGEAATGNRSGAEAPGPRGGLKPDFSLDRHADFSRPSDSVDALDKGQQEQQDTLVRLPHTRGGA